MAVITLFSASGAPGVTSTALGMALAWRRPVYLVDADATGSPAVLAGYLQGQATHDRGLVELAVANRMGNLNSAIATVAMEIPGSKVSFVPGVRSHQQAASLVNLWEPLTGVLRGMERRGTDVIIDAGRIGVAHSAQPLVRSADLSLLVVRSDLPAVAGARSWARAVREQMASNGTEDGLGLVLVGPGRPYGAREIRKVLGLPVVAEIPWEPRDAAVLSTGAQPGKKYASGALQRALATAVSSAQGVIATNRQRLNAAPRKAETHV
ncbi:hypothetical protein AWH69_04020 [Janibacter melonis]|uniref:ParA family protein n=1 Tax=Janibacter melonis TaxID=262209 RepID=A0A176QGZ7_9MICO|nr:hypothetical protein [Janibacter melonis]MBD5830605.1 hypothetical protein [Janibacter melonis]OAB88941.1 hypothetical protein AWH69_04020 [Janibacter melonis]